MKRTSQYSNGGLKAPVVVVVATAAEDDESTELLCRAYAMMEACLSQWGVWVVPVDPLLWASVLLASLSLAA